MKIKNSNIFLRHLICFSIFGMNVILASGGLLQTTQSGQVLNWEDLKAVYYAYINCPSHENAKALLDALPLKRPGKTIGDAERTQLHIFGGANFPILYSEVQAGDRLAVEIMFRIYNIAAGAYSESAGTVLAGLVRSKPRLFIEVLSVYKDLEVLKGLGCPVDFVGEGYESHPYALKHEYEKRIEALESVKDPIYSEIIETCIKILRDSIKKYAQKAP